MKLPWNNTNSIILILAVTVVAISLFYFPLRSDESIPNSPLIDDSYMYFSIASNIAMGNGISDNGKELTNGFQPLYAFLITPIFMIFPDNDLLPLRIIYILHIIIYLLTSYIIAYTSVLTLFGKNRHKLSSFIFWSVFILYLSTSQLQYTHLNGLETGLLLLFYSVMWLYYTLTGIKSLQNALMFGILLGFAILTRLDVGIFALCFAMFYCIDGYRKNTLAKSVKYLLVIAIIATFTSMPWWIYSLTVFNEILPSSGQALSPALNNGNHPYSAYSLDIRIIKMFRAVAIAAFPQTIMPLETNVFFTLSRTILISIVGLVAFRSVRLKTTKDYIVTSSHYRHLSFQFATIFLTTIMILCIYYTLDSKASWFYSRYMMPLSIFIFVIVVPHAIVVAYVTLGKTVLIGLFSIYVMFPVLLILASEFGFSVGIELSYQPQLELIESHVPSQEWVASMESGYVSYFRGHIVNLDGKTNMDVVRALDKGNIIPYLDEKNIDWVVLVGDGFRESFAPNFDQASWTEIAKDRTSTWTLLHRQDVILPRFHGH